MRERQRLRRAGSRSAKGMGLSLSVDAILMSGTTRRLYFGATSKVASRRTRSYRATKTTIYSNAYRVSQALSHACCPPPTRSLATMTSHKALMDCLQGVTYPFRWARDSCQCPRCIYPCTRQERHRTTTVASDVLPPPPAWRAERSWCDDHLAF